MCRGGRGDCQELSFAGANWVDRILWGAGVESRTPKEGDDGLQLCPRPESFAGREQDGGAAVTGWATLTDGAEVANDGAYVSRRSMGRGAKVRKVPERSTGDDDEIDRAEGKVEQLPVGPHGWRGVARSGERVLT